MYLGRMTGETSCGSRVTLGVFDFDSDRVGVFDSDRVGVDGGAGAGIGTGVVSSSASS